MNRQLHRWAAVALAAMAFCACESDASQEQPADTAIDTPDTDAASETVTPPAWTPPAVEGVEALDDLDPAPDVVEVELTAQMTRVDMGEGVELDMMTYNGQFPGPLIQAKVGDTVVVHFQNQLEEPTTIHWHGLRIPSEMDGTPRVQEPVQPGESFTYRFVVPDEGTFWYHPHVRAHEQVERGLYGPLIVHREDDTTFARERVLILDDMLLTEDDLGNVDFADFDPHQHGLAMHGRGGNVLLTNGRFAGEAVFTANQGQVERWRLINTTNASTFSLSLEGVRFRVIGTDGGRIAQPYITERLEVAVGQRYDLEILLDTAGEAVMNAHVLALDDNNNVIEVPYPMATAQIEEMSAPSPVPTVPPTIEEPPVQSVSQTIEMRFAAYDDGNGGIAWAINEESNPSEPLFSFQEGEYVEIRLVNQAGPEHPFHLHGQFFEVVDDGRAFTVQPGLKDTVLVPGGTTMTIRAWMDNPGQWMAHCHILEHAELGMMSEIVVEPAP